MIFSWKSVAATAMLIGAAPAMASGDAAQVEVTSTVDPSCSFTTKPPATKTIAPVAGEYVVGDLGYTCNFAGNAKLVLVLPNGTNFNNPANGATDVAYGVRWLVAPNNSSTGWQSFPAGNVSFTWPNDNSMQANVELKGPLEIKLATNLPVAGTYKTIIGYTITP